MSSPRKTKLQGRADNRKNIPYITSQFKKDKILLRRVKLNVSEFQVTPPTHHSLLSQILVALNDSSCMSDFRSCSIALQSLATISLVFVFL